MFRRSIARALVVLAALAGVVAIPSAAQAIPDPGDGGPYGPPCYSLSCDGYNPAEVGCDSDAWTAAYAHTPSTPRAELRISQRCKAAWARSVGYYYVKIERLDPPRIETANANFYTGQVWTRMVGMRGYKVRACYWNASSSGCTAWITFY
ncbi:MAG TPA: DUF2690 domain-containing protein [Micromonosporaceae bacterium]|nr:DUF2690 domain-containing protein [Micromonosporaceae bacterium]